MNGIKTIDHDHQQDNMTTTTMGMQCNEHPNNKNNVAGGICAFCLQEKLGNLLTSPSPNSFFNSSPYDDFNPSSSPPSPSSSSPRFRSTSRNGNNNVVAAANNASLSLSMRPISTTRTHVNGNNGYAMSSSEYTRKAIIPFLLAKKKKKLMVSPSPSSSSSSTMSTSTLIPRDHVNCGGRGGGGSGSGGGGGDHVLFMRSKSTTTPSRTSRTHFSYSEKGQDFISPRRTKNGFWSFLYHHPSSSRNLEKPSQKENGFMGSSSSSSINVAIREESQEEDLSTYNADSRIQIGGQTPSAERKVSRSRSVGCGSRSFSNDFLERISNGFGDCTTLRRVESHRESFKANSNHHHTNRVKCGGIFSGFMVTTPNNHVHNDMISNVNDGHKQLSAASGTNNDGGFHSRSRSWGWAFASPIRAFSNSSGNKSAFAKAGNKKRSTTISTSATTTPNLASIPSLLAL